MLTTENLERKNYFPSDGLDEKNLYDVENSEPIIFDRDELKYFVAEIKEMAEDGKIIDIPKAIHNAKYFAELAGRFANVKAGHWTEHELIEDDGDE